MNLRKRFVFINRTIGKPDHLDPPPEKVVDLGGALEAMVVIQGVQQVRRQVQMVCRVLKPFSQFKTFSSLF
jgi:hypothetical protein